MSNGESVSLAVLDNFLVEATKILGMLQTDNFGFARKGLPPSCTEIILSLTPLNSLKCS